MNDASRNEHGPASLDEKLVAFLLGEADAATSAEVEAALDADAGLRARRADLESALGLLRTPEIAPALAQERRDALRAAAAKQASGGAAAAAPAGRMRRFPMLRAAAGLLVFGGIVALATQRPWYASDSVRSDAALDNRALDALGYTGEDREVASEEGAPVAGQSAAESQPEAGRGDARNLRTGDDAKDGAGGERMPAGSYKGPSDAVPPGQLGFLGTPQGETESLELVVDEALRMRSGAGDVLLALPDPSAKSAPAEVLAQRPEASVSSPGGPSTPVTPNTVSGLALVPGARDGVADSTRRAAGEVRTVAPGRVTDNRAEPLFERQLSGDIPAGGGVDRYAFDYEYLGGEVSDLGGNHGGGRCLVVDGYGRRYVDAEVFDHLRPHHGQRGHESPRDMFFRFYGDNPVVWSADQAISTFAADVDTASYPLARNYLLQGHLPAKDAVRTEEFVNYFPLGLQAPAEGDFAVYLDAAPSRFVIEPKLLLRAGIKAREVSRAERKPLNLVFVIDTSGSMASGNRLELVKRSLELLVDQVRDDDTIGIVRFSSDASEVLAPTVGAQRWEIREAVRNLSTGGSTNAGAGLELGYAMAERAFRDGAVNRVVLASDGVANTGETDQERILASVRAKAEAHIDLTTIGVGMGNHNDVFLEQLADKGDGACHYVDDFEEAKRVLVDGFTGTMQTVARDVKIQVEFDGEIVLGWRQLGYENRSLTAEQFRDDSVDAGEIGAGHEIAALYELDLQPGAEGDTKLVTLRLRWFPDGADEAVEEEHTLSLAEARTKWALAEPAFRLSAVAAQFAEVLRRSWHARDDSYAVLREESESLAREVPDARVAELRDLIARTESLARRGAQDDPLVMLLEEARRTRLLEARLAMQEQDQRVTDMLEEVRKQNERIENQLKELLEKP
jgi:Ca-activated chloride channel family protein